MGAELLERRLSEALEKRERRVFSHEGLRRAAVLVPLFRKEGSLHLLFTKRTEWLRDHKGQISFPGGGYHEEDGTLLTTALRECLEEIGLMPGHVRLVGALDDEPTWVSGYIITPYVGVIPYPYDFKVNSYEIEELIEVPVSALMDEGCLRVELEERRGGMVKTYFYTYKGKVIWGATARILNGFLEILGGALGEEVGRCFEL